MKKVTVIDFVDLQNRPSELGKYIAEQLTVNLVTENPEFAVLDRANLKSILKEHKLTATGLIDPENAKQLGLFAGVDAIILGTIIPKKGTVSLTARIITTETAEIVGASKAEFATDETVKELLAATTHEAESSEEELNEEVDEDSSKISKDIGELRIEFLPLRIVNGREYALTMTLTNRSKKSIWVNVSSQTSQSSVIDPRGEEFRLDSVAGLPRAEWTGVDLLAEIKPKEAKDVTARFLPGTGFKATPGTCRLQMSFLVSPKYTSNSPSRSETYPSHNILVKLEAK